MTTLNTSIEFIDISKYNPHVNLENKHLFGEIHTPYAVATDLLNMLPEEVFNNPRLTWCEPGAGHGNISIVLFHKLFQKLMSSFQTKEECKWHVLQMITLIELNKVNVDILKTIFTEDKVVYKDFLNYFPGEKYDVLFGNPPFNSNGTKKVPTSLTSKMKTDDGETVWCDFIIHSLNLVKDNGYLCMIIPCIWMKPDKANIYSLLTKYEILKLKCFTNTESNAMFYGEAQTPCVFVVVQKTLRTTATNNIAIFDKINNQYVNFVLHHNMPIPFSCPSIIQKIFRYTQDVGSIQVHKTNMPSKGIELNTKQSNTYKFVNIKTCVLNGLHPEFEYLYSVQQCPYFNMPKIIMAHGMYGFPFIDTTGQYGIANRDKYIIVQKSKKDMETLAKFLSTKSCLMFFEATKYRMRFLEKYIFEYIPDITKIENFPTIINDDSIADFFGFNDLERKSIATGFKTYGSFPIP